MKFLRTVIATILLCCCISSESLALEFQFINKPNSHVLGTVLLTGQIEKGDNQKLLSLLVDGDPFSSQAWAWVNYEINSTGGDIEESELLASTLNQIHATVIVRNTCSGTCIFLFLAGATRLITGEGKLGIQHVNYSPTSAALEFMGSDESFARRRYKDWLLSKGIPLDIYENIKGMPSSNIYWLTTKEMLEISVWPPQRDAQVQTKCGGLLSIPNDIFSSEFLRCYSEITNESKLQGLTELRKKTSVSYFQ